MIEISATQARRRIYELVRRVQTGEEFLIVYGRHRNPVGVLKATKSKIRAKKQKADEVGDLPMI